MIADYTGNRYHRLLVVGMAPSRNRGNRRDTMVQVRCDCGMLFTVLAASLTGGNTKSCGCLKRETTIARSTKHGRSQTVGAWGTWASMLSRCRNSTLPCYKYYGGRGIKVCDRWLRFENFLSDMGDQPTGMSLDRIDNDGDYELSNCRWATRKEQMRNTRTNRLITINGQTKCLKEWAEVFSIPYDRVRYRLNNGWSIERAFA